MATPRARVVVVQDDEATRAFLPDENVPRAMVERGILRFTGTTCVTTAWQSVVSTNDVVGLKVFSSPGASSGTRRAVVAGVIEGLLEAGLPPAQIIVWDKQLGDLRRAGYDTLARRYNVRLAGGANTGYDENVFYESALIGNLIWGDFEFGREGEGLGRKSYVSKLVSEEITKHISIAPLLNHNTAGVAGNLYSLSLGSVDNTMRFEPHGDRLATAIPEIMALPEIFDRLALNIVDALICQYEGEQRTLLHYSTALNQIWFSADPVALDVLALRELNRQRERQKVPPRTFRADIYSNAALMELGIADLKLIEIDDAGAPPDPGRDALPRVP